MTEAPTQWVLVVADDDNIAELVATALLDEGLDVVAPGDGCRALDAARRYAPARLNA